MSVMTVRILTAAASFVLFSYKIVSYDLRTFYVYILTASCRIEVLSACDSFVRSFKATASS
jgi:hypothetical protein